MNSRVHPDHHLWRNGRLWWIAFTVHLPGWRKERVRRSLGTNDLTEARRRRDHLLRGWTEADGGALSLRFAPRPQGALQTSQWSRITTRPFPDPTPMGHTE